MEYKCFSIKSFERQLGQWRARICRISGKPLRAGGRKPMEQFVTAFDAPTAEAAMVMAMKVVDAGLFSRATEVRLERFWRRQQRNEHAEQKVREDA